MPSAACSSSVPRCPLLTGLDSRDIPHQDEAGLERLLTQRQVNASTQRRCRWRSCARTRSSCTWTWPMQRILALAMHAGGGREVSQVLHIRDVSQQFEVDRLKSEFLTTAAHELRTPMTSIYGFTELLTTRQLSAERQRELLGRIYRQSRAMMDILDELLDLARIEARSAQDFVFTQVLLEDLARETAEDSSRLKGGRPSSCCCRRRGATACRCRQAASGPAQRHLQRLQVLARRWRGGPARQCHRRGLGAHRGA